MKSQKKKKTDHAPRRRRAEDSRRFLFCFCFFLADDCGSEKMKNKRRTTKHTTDPRDTMRRGQRPKNDCEPKRVRRRHFIGKKRRKKKRRQGRRFLLGVTVCVYDVFLSLSLSLCWPSFRPNDTDSSDPSRVFFLFVCLFFRGFCFWVKAKEKAPPGWAGDWLAGDWQGLWHPPWSDRGSTGWPFQGRPAARRKHGSRNRKRNSLKKNSIRERPNGQTGCHPLETR